MARSKSISGNKISRAKVNKGQAESGVAAGDPQVSQAGQTLAEAAPAMNTSVSDPIAAKTDNAERIDGSSSSSESKPASDSRKLEVVRTDSRKNLVPINLEDEIRRRAYEIYELRGAGAGSEADDWFAAESEVRQRYRQQSA